MEFSLELDIKDTLRAIRVLRERAPIAQARALNRSVASGKTVMVREMSRDLGMKASAVRETVIVREASQDRLQAQLISSGKRIPLIDFSASGPEPSRGRGRGVTYKLGGGRKRLTNAFIAKMASGHRGVFQRSTKARLPIHELRGPSLPHVFNKFRSVALARMLEQLSKNLKSEFRFALQRS